MICLDCLGSTLISPNKATALTAMITADHICIMWRPKVVPTVLPSGTVWDMKKGRLLIGLEALALQGIQFDSPEITNNHCQDLAGNAYICLNYWNCKLFLSSLTFEDHLVFLKKKSPWTMESICCELWLVALTLYQCWTSNTYNIYDI